MSFVHDRRTFLAAASSLAAAGLVSRRAFADDAADRKKLQELVDKAISFLQTKGQAADGSFTKQVGIGITALAATAMMRHGRSPEDPSVAKALKYLEQNVQPTGGIHAANGRLKTYETCVALLAFVEANRDGKYDEIIKKAEAFIKKIPFDAEEGNSPEDFQFGGAGYGGQGRPDLSNTAYLIEALKAAGAGEDDPAIKNALIFVSRCQNLESPHNTTPFAAKVNDGGFYYTPLPGNDDATTASGGLRSYGAMSYAGLKSMAFAGVKPDDPRVQAVRKWVAKNYDVKTHPGQGEAGLFYYYNTFAKALEANGEAEITDADGKKHNWRKDLIDELARRQKDDGSWANANQRWFETDPNLSTSFALLALSYCVPEKK
ncbi:MAG TPA: prenyltransferase/squalene oxidase repeat-containing protein [Pirellulaceae bacterium]|nr:prenyltransferase/squalene oxidase repeat-containing protein [Pirellulaceae bacterium]